MAGSGTVAVPTGLGGLEIVDHDRYPGLIEGAGIDMLSDVLAENIGDDGLQIRDLTRVPMPAAGSTTWEIPDKLTGKNEITAELVGTLAFWQAARVFWIPTEDGSLTGEPPDCSSADGKFPVSGGMYALDGLNGHLNPGGKCSTCPLSKFGSSTRGSGKAPACAERRLLFVSRPGELLPMLVSAPPTSLDPLKAFMIALSMRYQAHYSAFELGISLDKQEKNGTKFATLHPQLKGVLEGALPRSKGWAAPGSPAARALEFSRGFEKLLAVADVIDLATGQARGEAAAEDDGLGGEFDNAGQDGP
jgi:hypothetical protein